MKSSSHFLQNKKDAVVPSQDSKQGLMKRKLKLFETGTDLSLANNNNSTALFGGKASGGDQQGEYNEEDFQVIGPETNLGNGKLGPRSEMLRNKKESPRAVVNNSYENIYASNHFEKMIGKHEISQNDLSLNLKPAVKSMENGMSVSKRGSQVGGIGVTGEYTETEMDDMIHRAANTSISLTTSPVPLSPDMDMGNKKLVVNADGIAVMPCAESKLVGTHSSGSHSHYHAASKYNDQHGNHRYISSECVSMNNSSGVSPKLPRVALQSAKVNNNNNNSFLEASNIGEGLGLGMRLSQSAIDIEGISNPASLFTIERDVIGKSSDYNNNDYKRTTFEYDIDDGSSSDGNDKESSKKTTPAAAANTTDTTTTTSLTDEENLSCATNTTSASADNDEVHIVLDNMEVENVEEKVIRAVISGNVIMIERMATMGNVNFNFRDEQGHTPLHHAAYHGRLNAVEFLLQLNLDVNSLDNMGRTPLDMATSSGWNEVANILRAAGGTAKKDMSEKLCELVASEDNYGKVKSLVDLGINISCRSKKNYLTPLHIAATNGSLKIVELLCKNGANVNSIDSWGATPLQKAIYSGHKEVEKYLKEIGAISLNPSDAYELCKAAAGGELYKLKALVELKGVPTDSKDYDGRTAMHLAASEGRIEIVKYLVEQGADMEVVDRWGINPYQDALRYGHFQIAEWLVQENADVIMNNELSVDDPNVEDNILDHAYDDYAHCCSRFGRNKKLMHTAFNTLLNHIGSSYDWDYCEFWTINPKYLVLECCHDCYYINEKSSNYKKLQRFKDISTGVLIEYDIFFGGSVLKKRISCWFTNLTTLPQVNFFRSPMCRMAGLQTCVAIPVSADTELFGAIVLFSNQNIKPSKLHLTPIISSIGELVSGTVKWRNDLLSAQNYGKTIAECLKKDDSNNFIIDVLCETKMLEVVFKWANTPKSVDHKAAIKALDALCDKVPSLIGSQYWEYIIKKLTRSLYFLVSVSLDVSPPNSKETPVVVQAQAALKKISATIDIRKPPYYIEVNSPIMLLLLDLKTRIQEQFQLLYSKNYDLNSFGDKNNKMEFITSADTFRAFGKREFANSGGRTPGIKPKRNMYGQIIKSSKFSSESDMAAKMLNTLIATHKDDFVTLENVLKLHSCLLLDKGCEDKSGKLRNETVVGSFQFYRFYHVYMPKEEIKKAMSYVCRFYQMNKDLIHPVLMAYFVYQALVHYIHPFADGNGRMGRLLANVILKLNGYLGIFMSDDKILEFGDYLSRLEKLSVAVKGYQFQNQR